MANDISPLKLRYPRYLLTLLDTVLEVKLTPKWHRWYHTASTRPGWFFARSEARLAGTKVVPFGSAGSDSPCESLRRLYRLIYDICSGGIRFQSPWTLGLGWLLGRKLSISRYWTEIEADISNLM